MLSLEKGRVIESLYMDDRIQILKVENLNKTIIEEAINYIDETGICSVYDIVIINTIGNRLKLGTGGYNFVYLNLSSKLEDGKLLDRKDGHIIKMKYSPGQIRVKAVEENYGNRNIFDMKSIIPQKPVVYSILHSMLFPLIKTIKNSNPNTIISCIYTYGGAMNANNSFTLKKLRSAGLVNSVITTGECYGGDYEAINIMSGILFGINGLYSDIIIVCCGPGVAGSSTYYGFSTFDFIGAIYMAKVLGLLPVIIPRISMADSRERHLGISMQSIAILQSLDFPVHVPVYKDNEDREGFNLIYKQLCEYGIIDKHIIKFIDDATVKKNIDYIAEGTKVMGRNYTEDSSFFYNCSSAGLYSVGLLKKNSNY